MTDLCASADDPDEAGRGDVECYSLGHDEETTHEDDEVWQGTCRRCGAELFHDKQDGEDQ